MLRRFFKAIKAPVGIIMETELWPNVIVEASRANVSLFLANARISNHAFKQYELLRFFFKPLLNQFNFILAQSARDAERFVALGALPSRVRMLGNMKFDVQVTVMDPTNIAALKHAWGIARTVVIAASTHEGEERQLLSVFRQLQQAIPDVFLLIAPRHPERFQSVYALSQQQGFTTARRSESAALSPDSEVMVIDSLGELLSFYAVSDYAFVGGSWLPAVGGHNVLEPIALNVPVCCGTYMQNSQSIIDALLEAHAIIQVTDARLLVEAIVALHHDAAERSRQVANARSMYMANQGSVLRHMEVIQSLAMTEFL